MFRLNLLPFTLYPLPFTLTLTLYPLPLPFTLTLTLTLYPLPFTLTLYPLPATRVLETPVLQRLLHPSQCNYYGKISPEHCEHCA